jgi:uncharacterized protein
MDVLFGGLTGWAFLLACAVTVFAGFVKGAIGFAMPLIMIATFSSFMAPETALAAMILSILTTNVHQSLRFGWRPAVASAAKYWRILVTTCVGIAVSAPFIAVVPQQVLFAILGVPILAFALMQLSGWVPQLHPRHRVRAEYALGTVGGLYGGLTGIWGQPAIVYLLAIRAEKTEMVRVLGVVFTVGAVVLVAAHLLSGLLNAVTLPLSAALIVPAALGMWLGFRMQDRLDQERFRRWMLIVLMLVALNLLRRAITG